MIYSFAQDLESSKNSYNNFNELYKNKDNLTRKVNESGAQIGDGYSLDNYEISSNKGGEEDYDNDDYTNKGGSKKVIKAIEKTNKTFNESDEEKENKGVTTDSVIQTAGLGLEIAQGFSTTSGSESEGWMQAGQWGLKGAEIGMSVGGPWGAAIGGVVGAGAGIYDAIADSGKRNAKKRKTVDAQNDSLFTKRELEGSMKADEKRIKQLTNLRKNQLNYINLDY